jgi:UDP-N-acetylmuramoyl-L-alanyl-D-glutamate--2,6-diaminopimelate ligase
MQLSQLLKGLNTIDIAGKQNGDVSTICYDSGKCEKNSLFTAIAGFNTDGHLYIGKAIENGARFIVHQKDYKPPKDVTAIRVSDSRRALGQIGRNFFRDPSSSLYFIAVIGTNGKTTTTYLLEAILKAAGHSVGVIGTVNYRYNEAVLPAPNTTPESFDLQRILREMVDNGVTHCISEVSSHAIDLHRVDECSFDMGIFTNLTQDHLDYHGTMERYFQAKKRFFSEVLPAGAKNKTRQVKPDLHNMIINGDDSWGQRLLKETTGKSITYGFGSSCNVTAKTFHICLEGIKATITLNNEELDIASPLMGKFNLYNILAAVAATAELGIPKEAIRSGLLNINQVPGRLEKIGGPGQPHVFVDYAHTEDALRRVLENLLAFKKGKIITVFGCGGNRDRGKRPLMGEAAAKYSDVTIITSDNPRKEDPLEIIREIEKGINLPKWTPDQRDLKNIDEKIYLVIPDRAEAIAKAISAAGSEDIVLIAGKGHETYQIIGEQKIPFDDRIEAGKALQGRRETVETT